MPSFVFIDRDGNDLGLIMEHPGWQLGDTLRRDTGLYRVVEIIQTNLPDIDGLVPIVVERMLDETKAP